MIYKRRYTLTVREETVAEVVAETWTEALALFATEYPATFVAESRIEISRSGSQAAE